MIKNKSEESFLRRKKENYKNQRQVIKLLKKISDEKKPNLSLEVGCGDGYFSEIISSFSRKVIAVDIKREMASSVASKKNIIFKFADGRKLPFRDKSFDFVFSIDVIEHIFEDQKFINENLRVLKRNGLLVIVTPNKLRLSNRFLALFGFKRHFPVTLGYDFMGDEVIHVREYIKTELLHLIGKSQFKIRSIKIIGCFLGISGNFGFINCPKIFEDYCGSWFLIAERN